MASNNVSLTQSNHCNLCKLSGLFEASDENSDPIEEIVKAVGVKFLPWEVEGQLQDVGQFRLADLWGHMDVVWQHESVVNLKRDEIRGPNAEKAESHERANRAEVGTSELVR